MLSKRVQRYHSFENRPSSTACIFRFKFVTFSIYYLVIIPSSGPTSDKILEPRMAEPHRLLALDDRSEEKRAEARVKLGYAKHNIKHLLPVFYDPLAPDEDDISSLPEEAAAPATDDKTKPRSRKPVSVTAAPATDDKTKPRVRQSASVAYADGCEKFYDYNRLITNLLGGRQKLSVKPDHDSFYFAE